MVPANNCAHLAAYDTAAGAALTLDFVGGGDGQRDTSERAIELCATNLIRNYATSELSLLFESPGKVISKEYIKKYISKQLQLRKYCLFSSPGGSEFLHSATDAAVSKNGFICPLERNRFISQIVKNFASRFFTNSEYRDYIEEELCRLLLTKISYLATTRAC